MRVVRVFDIHRPAFLQGVLDLLGDLLIGQIGQVGELALGDAVTVIGHHG